MVKKENDTEEKTKRVMPEYIAPEDVAKALGAEIITRREAMSSLRLGPGGSRFSIPVEVMTNDGNMSREDFIKLASEKLLEMEMCGNRDGRLRFHFRGETIAWPRPEMSKDNARDEDGRG